MNRKVCVSVFRDTQHTTVIHSSFHLAPFSRKTIWRVLECVIIFKLLIQFHSRLSHFSAYLSYTTFDVAVCAFRRLAHFISAVVPMRSGLWYSLGTS